MVGAIDPLGALDSRFDEAPEHLDDDTALFGFDRWQRAAPDRRGNFLERKSRHVYPLFVELKHSRWSIVTPTTDAAVQMFHATTCA